MIVLIFTKLRCGECGDYGSVVSKMSVTKLEGIVSVMIDTELYSSH